MSEKKTCQVCQKPAQKCAICKSCGRDYCAKCQSPSTTQPFCKDCVALDGVVTRK